MKKLMVVGLAMCSWACGGMEMEEQETRSDVPKVRAPLQINGQRYSPDEALALFGDKIVGYFVDEEAQAGGFVYAFTSHEEERAFLREWEEAHPRDEQAMAGDTDSIFYEHIGNGGASIRLPAMTAEPDLTRFGCLFYMPCGFWNDKISSVTPSRLNRYTLLYPHINYGGVPLRLSNGVNYYDLTNEGFNDMASSISFEY
jgi:hypothetical protein